MILISILLFSVQAWSISPVKPSPPEMRHGFNIVTGPKRTIEGVNNPQSIENGKRLYQLHCIACHGKNGEGDGQLAKDFGVNPANLKAVASKYANHTLVIQINKGKGKMPKWQDLLSESQIWDLTNFIQTLNSETK